VAPGTAHARFSTRKLLASVGILAATVGALLVGAIRPFAADSPDKPAVDHTLPVVALAGYNVSLFARGTTAWTGPDSIVVSGDHVFIDYQNVTAKDCTDHNLSTVVQYSDNGHAQRSWSIEGHSDGMRLDPSTHLLWATVCEDGNPALYTINPTARDGDIHKYSLTAPHGGGYDDIAFTGGKAFLAASNPTLNGAGVNTFPAIVSIQLNADLTTTLTPVLMGNAASHDIVNNVNVTLNEVDPDSMTIGPMGQLVLVNQGGSELVFVADPGAAGQSVTNAPVGTQLDDTAYARTPSDRLFVVDGTQNATYIVRSNFVSGTVYTETPNDSGVTGLLGTVSLATGRINPVAIGFGKPTGILFAPADSGGDH
jgi:hypothetical protein